MTQNSANSNICSFSTVTILGLLIITNHCYNLTCNGRGGYTKITIKNDMTYTPQFRITFGIQLEENQTLTENLTISLKSDNQCIPNQSHLNFNFSESECKPFLNFVSCGRKVYLNCTKEYKQKNTQISYTAQGNILYLNRSLSCSDSGQVVVWQKREEPTDSMNIGLIVGLSIGGIILLAITGFVIWKCKKTKRERLLNQEEN